MLVEAFDDGLRSVRAPASATSSACASTASAASGVVAFGKIGPEHAIAEGRLEFRRGGACQRRLADASRPGESHESYRGMPQEATEGIQLRRSSDDLMRSGGQPRSPLARGGHRASR